MSAEMQQQSSSCGESSAVVDLKLSGQGKSQQQKRTNYPSWSEYFMMMAVHVSSRSKDPKRQVGAVLVDSDNREISTGYNGLPDGCNDDDFPWSDTACDDCGQASTKYPYVVHAEVNAIMNCLRRTTSMPTMAPLDLGGCTLYVTRHPCNECAKMIVQAKIKSVVYYHDPHPDRTEYVTARRIFEAAKVETILYSGVKELHLCL